jgi:hypothetical protein
VARTVAAYVLACAVLFPAWLSLGATDRPANRALAAAILAFLPVLLVELGKRRWIVALATVFSAALTVQVAFERPITDARPGERDFFGPVLSSLKQGFLDFFDTRLPFNPVDFPDMQGVPVLAVFGFAVAVGIAIAARRTFLAVALLVLGVGWPATMSLTGDDTNKPLLLGGALLAVILAIVLLMRPRTRGVLQAAVALTVLVALAGFASTSTAVAKGNFVQWNDWDFYDRPDDPVDVRYIWDANYEGISFPEKKTEVLRVKVEGPKRSLYWRATSLDDYTGEVWTEALQLSGRANPNEAVDVTEIDPLLPQAARNRENWVRQDVTIEALADTRLVGSAQAVRWEPSGEFDTDLFTNGALQQEGVLERGQKYTVYSWIPRARPPQLDEAGTGYPGEVEDRYLNVGPPGVRSLPRFGLPGREQDVEDVFATNTFMQDQRILWETASEVADGATSPYQAAFKLESWFRGQQGGFTYDEQPPSAGDTPPLAAFLETKRGYCQHFAGAMALMLRYLGVPARVAAGFTSGTYDPREKEWTVTDHNAHTWVEVYFPDYGWIPFDPTPDRGELTASYTAFSPAFDVREAAGLTGLANIPEVREQLDRAGGIAGREGQNTGAAGVPEAVARQGRSVLTVLFFLVVIVVGAIVLAKQIRRGLRFATRDPRELASACRRDLAGYLADQGIEVPSSTTPSELGALTEERFPVNAKPFVAALGAARYGPPSSSRSAAGNVRTELRRLRKRLRGSLGVSERARGLVRLRSLTL